jgi:RNA polymerase sigma-70 factor (family 1)
MDNNEISRHVQWDEAAFHWLYDEYYKSLVAYAMRFIGIQERGEDIVQEVFVHIYNTRQQFESFLSLRNYLFRSVRNHCLDDLRHRSVVESYNESVVSQGEATTEDDEADSFREEFYRRMFRLIDSMPPRQRSVFVEAMKGKTNKEIADKLGVSIDTVKTQKKRGMKLLRDKLSQSEFVVAVLLFM